ncbi:MAG: DUF6644 family protein [Woeseiaceae bacterium]|nr:DUF6644 family protein [Woeseiaceae bacterium]
MQALITAIEGSAVNEWVLGSAWVWPILEIVHFVGLSLLLGSMLVVDLRLAGLFRRIDLAATHRLLPWAAIGFAMNLVSGTLFVLGDPARYYANIGFRFKMLLVLVAGLNALWFYLRINPVLRDRDPHGDTPAAAKTIAVVSLATWAGVLLLGRLIPYIGTG